MSLTKKVFVKLIYYLSVLIVLWGTVQQTTNFVFADGLSQTEQKALTDYPNWVPDYGQCSATSTVQTIPAGILPTFIPEPYNGAFTAGAKAHNVSPSLIAALFSEEHNLGGSETAPDTSTTKLAVAWANLAKTHTDPNSGWDSSTAGAQGPFQFMPATFTGLGYDVSQINNLLISADAAAKYAQTDKATIDQLEASWQPFIFSYNHLDSYVTAVFKYYDFYSSQPPASGQGTPTTLIVSGCQSTSVDCSIPNSATNGLSQTRQTIVCLAQSELALWKSQSNYSSPYPQFTYAQTGFLKYSGGIYEQWCADFVSWVYKQAGYSFDFNSNWRVGYVPNIQLMGVANNKFHWHPAGSGYIPKPGDLAIYGAGHVNILVAVNGNVTTYIGGDQDVNNQSSVAYGTKSPPSGSVVSIGNSNGYFGGSLTGYVSPE